MRISVVVPVYNHWHLVPTLIVCLEAQTLDKDFFEVLLVDNGSDNPPPAENFPEWVRVLECSTPGSYAARNRALRQARAPLLAFTDADCRPAPEWLSGLWRCYDSADMGDVVIAGRIVVEPVNWQDVNAYELYDVALGLPQERYVKRGYGVTANLAIPRPLLEKLGGFDARRYSGGDADLCRRTKSAGARLVYCEEALVVHPARRSWNELTGKVRRIKGGQIRSGTLRRRFMFVARTLMPPVFAWYNALRAARLTPRQRLKVCVIQAALWCVEVGELFRLLAGGAPKRN